MRLFYLFCVFVTLCPLVFGLKELLDPSNRPRVSLMQGLLLGSIKKSEQGKDIESFEGIPYAKPPVGKRRFKEPKAPKPWKGIWDASSPGSPCMQYSHFSRDIKYPVVGDEDCLYLNVYRPKGAFPGQNLPVIVFIHGGCFMYGNGDFFGPKYLLDRNLILVTFNYRLGPMGFLSTEDDIVPGNNGLKDQNLALRWIRDNIIHFGGDINRITLTGLSAGANSVHYHYLSPLSRGLFARGISFSGATTAPWALAERPLQKAQKIAASLGCPTDTNWLMIDCLRHRSGRKIVEAVELFQPWLFNPISPFGPVIERTGMLPFLSEHPLDLLNTRRVLDIPWIVTVTSSEGLYPAAEFLQSPAYLQQLERNWLQYAPHVLEYNDTIPLAIQNSVSEKIKEYYLKGEKISEKTFPELVQLIGDRLFVVPVETAARLQAAATTSPVYLYRFTYRGQHSLSEAFSGRTENFGASHADDVNYILNNAFGSADDSEQDKKMTKLLVDFLEKYATFGIAGVGNVPWDAVLPNAKDIRYLEINSPDDYHMTSASELGHRSFWESIPFLERKTPIYLRNEL